MNSQKQELIGSKKPFASLISPTQSQAVDSSPGNGNTMFVNNIVKQLEHTRKQLEMKDKQMTQLNLYVQEVIKENT